jgi:chorismate mutase
MRGIRGATTLDADTAEQMEERVGELVRAVLKENDLDSEDIVSALFTTTPDLVAAFPAAVARRNGMADVPVMGAVEQDNPGGVARCVRLLVHAYLDGPREDVRHVFLEGATVLRPDLARP